jgi:outer membrane protein assembly factor BamB
MLNRPSAAFVLVGALALGVFPAAVRQAIAQPNTAPGRGDWSQFLGPHRNGISDEKNLIDEWPAAGPNEVWRAAGGVGMSGIAITRGRALTLFQKDGQQFLAAYDAQSGRPVWQTPLGPEYKNPQGDGPRATPTVSGDVALSFTGEGILSAVKFEDGQMLWSHNVVEELGGKVADYGMASSPLVVGDLVVVTAGAPQACVVAYGLQAGKLVWKGAAGPAGYSSPALLDVGGKKQIVAFTGDSAVGLTPATGELLWRFPYATDYNCNTATPIAIEGQVLLSSGENHGSVLLKLEASAGKYSAEEAWSSQGPRSVLRSEWQTPILLDGKLYGLDNIGSAGPVTNLVCINAASGERLWQQPRFGKSNLMAADGKLFFSTFQGELVVARASSNGYEEIGRKQILGPTRQSPAIANGLLYLRDDKEIVCLDVRK